MRTNVKTKHISESILTVLAAIFAKRSLTIKVLLACFPFAAWSAPSGGQNKKDLLLCSMNNAFYCDGRELTCNFGPSSDWNVPVFFEVDLAAKVMRTTKTSIDQRRTPLQAVLRNEGVIYAQGVDKGKGFTLVVAEDSGNATGSIVTDGGSLNLYGACMFMPK